jgi:hypothetical protein
MARYQVQWNYKSSLGGPFQKGDIVEFDDAIAEAINRDSPGVLKKKREQSNRMVAEADTRSDEDAPADEKADDGEDAPADEKADDGEDAPADEKADDGEDAPADEKNSKEEPITKDDFKAVK